MSVRVTMGTMKRTVIRTAAMFAGAAALGSAVLVGVADPASALVNVTTSGTTVTAAASGTVTIVVSCVNAKVAVNGSTGSPAVPCSTFTKLIVNGDSGGQTIDGEDLEASVFAAKPSLTANLGDGVDVVTPTSRDDSINLGLGNDILYMVRSVTDSVLDGGVGDNDYIRLQGSDLADEFVGSSNSLTLTVHHVVAGVDRVATAKNFDRIEAAGFKGNDIIDLSGINASSTLKSVGIYAGDGDDEVRGAQIASTLDGGPGTNQLFGGLGNDNILSSGNNDTIDGGDGSDRITDRTSGRSGRTIANHGTDSWYFVEMGQGDMISRIRGLSANDARVTNSLARPGQQELGNSFDQVVVSNGTDAVVNGRGVFDVVALNGDRDVSVRGDSDINDVLDVTIPTGNWTVGIDAGGDGWITPAAPGYKPIHVENMGQVQVHTPWPSKNLSFAHRVIRDLELRIPSDQERGALAGGLNTNTKTRAQIVAETMGTDTYRGLDVDRIFARYLRRQPDPSGRAYWINSIGSGKALWRFRAQLFGSNEYFTKAGGTNAQYLDKVYNDVLGRLPDPSGRAYWTKKLDAGADRGSVALQFINSSEFRRFIVEDQFLRFLDRKPTGAELNAWGPKITGTTTGEQDLIAYLAGSDEYYNRT